MRLVVKGPKLELVCYSAHLGPEYLGPLLENNSTRLLQSLKATKNELKGTALPDKSS
jgi:hypothetical protein